MALPGRSTSDISNYIAHAVQSAKDVDGTTFYFHKHLNGSGFDVENDVSVERVGGSGKEPGLVYKTSVKADGSIVTYAWPDALGRLLTAALGVDTPSVGTTGASTLTTHLIQPATGGTLPYLTVDQTWADETERTTNCLVSDLKLEGEATKPVKVTAQFISGGTPRVQTAALSPITREAGAPLMVPGGSAVWKVAGGEGGFGGTATTSQITKWSVEVKNTLDDNIRTLTLFREDVVWNMLDFNFDGTVKYVDRGSWNMVHYGGGTQVPVAVPTGAFEFYTPQTGATNSLFLSMPALQVGNVKVNRLDPDGKTMYLDFTAFGVQNASSSIFAKLVTTATLAYTNPNT